MFKNAFIKSLAKSKWAFLWIHIGITIALSIGTLFFDAWRNSLSLFFGSLFIAVNYGLIALVWGYIIRKKSIALAGFIIVLKYPLLFFGLRYMLLQEWITPVYFVAGLVLMIPSMILLAIIKRPRNKG